MRAADLVGDIERLAPTQRSGIDAEIEQRAVSYVAQWLLNRALGRERDPDAQYDAYSLDEQKRNVTTRLKAAIEAMIDRIEHHLDDAAQGPDVPTIAPR